MEKLFEAVLGMSGTASIAILLVLLVRLALRKAPRVFSYALWAVVLLRLLCPFTIESAFSLLPAAQVEDVPGLGGVPAQAVQVQTGITAVDQQVNGFFLQHPYQGMPDLPEYAGLPPQEPGPAIQQAGDVPDWRTVPAAVWLAGTALLLGYSLWSLLRLRRRLVGSVPLAGEKNVRLADHIPSPFVLGVFRPKIYLPSSLPEGERDYILLHERTHIRRGDHMFRALAWLALAVHWFNPLVWLAFRLAGKDMEMSCDEAVLRKMGRDVRADYSASLLRLSQGGRLPAGPLAFGGGDPQSRIKNVLSYQKPALWVMVLALMGVLCAGVALATDRSGGLIDPAAVTAVSVSKGGEHHTSQTLQEDLLAKTNIQTLSQEEGDGLVRIINSHRRAVYRQGSQEPSPMLDNWVRIDCTDGSFYMLHYWYWNGFSFNPLHFGEDDYTTLVTRYDAKGNAGTTWQMEYSFDQAFHSWQSGTVWPSWRASWAASSIAADLALSMEEGKDGVPFVRIEGTVDGMGLERTAWYPPEWFEQYEASSYPLGQLWFEAPLCGDEAACALDACWTDGSRTAVKVTATPTAGISSYSQAGNLIFTVSLEGGGTLLEMDGHIPKMSAGAPELVPTEEEAVRVGRFAAKLLLAAEDFYANARTAAPLGFTPAYAMYEQGRIRVAGEGLGRRAFLEWSPEGGLYFAGDPGGLCPSLAGKPAEGSASWTDQSRTALEVVFNVNDERVSSGTVSGFRIQFTVDLNSGAVLEKDFQSLVEGGSLELTDEEMSGMASILAELMRGAQDYYESGPPLEPAEALAPTVLGVSYSLNELGDGVSISGLDCGGAVWFPSMGDMVFHGLNLPKEGALGFLSVGGPRFLGGYFTNAQGSAFVLYYPEESAPLLAVFYADYGNGIYDSSSVLFTVDLAAGKVIEQNISGYAGEAPAPEFSDKELVPMARLLAGLIEGAAGSWDALSNPPPEEGSLPFNTPIEMVFSSGAGGWDTLITLHPDGAFEGNYHDMDMGDSGPGYQSTEYVCRFHGRFGDIRQATGASWSLTLEELVIDTGHPVGEEWIEPVTTNEGYTYNLRYISSGPYGFDRGDEGPLEPGAQFMFYTPEAKGYAPGDELYGINEQDDYESIMYQFRGWMPVRQKMKIEIWGPDTRLGCYALCSMETGRSFFDTQS